MGDRQPVNLGGSSPDPEGSNPVAGGHEPGPVVVAVLLEVVAVALQGELQRIERIAQAVPPDRAPSTDGEGKA